MKKLLLVAIVCLFSGSLFAQVSSPINFGFHAGLVSTKMDYKDASVNNIKEESKNGMMLGAFLRVNLNKWYLQPELNYVKRKSEVGYNVPAFGDVKTDVTTHSLDIPVLLGYKIVKLPMFKLRAFAGPVASFRVGDDLDVKVMGNTLEDVGDADFKNAVWNGKVGAGVDVWKLTLDLDYEFGLTDVSSEFLKKNKMFNVTLGFKLF
ncbi:MAG: porin family protein [Marinifilaceae bacterium]